MNARSRWRPSRLLLPLGALLALGYLAAMVVAGAMPVQRQLVRFEASGVLTLPPESVRRVHLRAGGRGAEVIRDDAGRWARADGGALPDAAAAQVDRAVKVMHRSGPVREIAAAELAGVDTRPFGLDDADLVVTVFADGPQPVLTARFGVLNPEGFLQYMRLDGDDRVYLMSRFVAGEWRDALAGVEVR